LVNDPPTRFFVASLVRIANSLDIRVLAQAVEDASMLPLLAELGVYGFQGYAAARPVPLSPRG